MASFLETVANLINIIESLQPLPPWMRQFIADVQANHQERKRMRGDFGNSESHNGALQPNQQRLNWCSEVFGDARDLIGACFEAFYPPRVVQLPNNMAENGLSNRTLMEIQKSLLDDHNFTICVCGIRGIGKTTLLKVTNNNIVTLRRFDVVVFVTVESGESFKHNIQEKMMRRLKLKFDENDDMMSRSVSLYNALKRKTYLLLLDNVLQDFPLHDIGIPNPDEENRSKIVIATQYDQVCNHMGADLVISVETLTDSEAWGLFVFKAGRLDLTPDIESLAKCVVKECKGLPIKITTAGAALRGKQEIATWRDALRELKNSTVSETPRIDGNRGTLGVLEP